MGSVGSLAVDLVAVCSHVVVMVPILGALHEAADDTTAHDIMQGSQGSSSSSAISIAIF